MHLVLLFTYTEFNSFATGLADYDAVDGMKNRFFETIAFSLTMSCTKLLIFSEIIFSLKNNSKLDKRRVADQKIINIQNVYYLYFFVYSQVSIEYNLTMVNILDNIQATDFSSRTNFLFSSSLVAKCINRSGIDGWHFGGEPRSQTGRKKNPTSPTRTNFLIQ